MAAAIVGNTDSCGEFDLIREFFSRPARDPSIALSIGDDAALLQPPDGMQLVVATDTLIAGVHFPESIKSTHLGYRALAVNLSDMAAMAADPWVATLALSLPHSDRNWLQGFAEGFFELADATGLSLVGGDTTRGPLCITVQVIGVVPQGQALLRNGALAGDSIHVTGMPGLAALGLAEYDQNTEQVSPCLQRFLRPEPRLDAGRKLRQIASSAIDVSDGLLADLGHIVAASGTGAIVRAAALPMLPEVLTRHGDSQCLQAALSGGDDYELCFTIPPQHRQAFDALNLDCHCIGEIVAEPGVQCIDASGRPIQSAAGYRHF